MVRLNVGTPRNMLSRFGHRSVAGKIWWPSNSSVSVRVSMISWLVPAFGETSTRPTSAREKARSGASSETRGGSLSVFSKVNVAASKRAIKAPWACACAMEILLSGNESSDGGALALRITWSLLPSVDR